RRRRDDGADGGVSADRSGLCRRHRGLGAPAVWRPWLLVPCTAAAGRRRPGRPQPVVLPDAERRLRVHRAAGILGARSAGDVDRRPGGRHGGHAAEPQSRLVGVLSLGCTGAGVAPALGKSTGARLARSLALVGAAAIPGAVGQVLLLVGRTLLRS